MSPEPRATYRLQLTPDFGFAEAAALVPYLADLGVSHLYLSPVLECVAGSAHGYDVVDPTRVSGERGGEAAFLALVEAAAAAGLGLMIDLVPNHMAIEGRQNPWWWDVLENGPSSPYATFFDVDWELSTARWPNKILLPVLGDHYGRVLEAGELHLVREGAGFVVTYYEHVFPVDPSSLAGVLGRAADAAGSELLGFLAESAARLPRPTVTGRSEVARRHRDKAVLYDLLARLLAEEPAAVAALDAEVARRNADPDALDELLEAQNYRLAFWRAADRDLGYRRFFDIHSLAGLRMEDEEVFAATHALPIAWHARGVARAFRIDHPDGLRDPAGYLDRLAAACPGAWIVVEKILETGESLPPDWPVAGTTGYDFLNLVDGLFVDPAGEAPFTRLWREFTGDQADAAAVVAASKHDVLDELLGSELNRLAARFVAICENHRRHRDYTRHELRSALGEVAAAFPVYRTYVRAADGAVSETDERRVLAAVTAAAEARPDLSPELFQFLEDVLLLRVEGGEAGALAMRFQQLTGPAMAKGVEDTAFYRYLRFPAVNEVGGDPARFGVSVEDFHAAMEAAAHHRPRALLATSTHDTKRDEDVRGRLATLSEVPEAFAKLVGSLSARAERYRTGDRPDRRAEYLLWHTLVGAWPIDAERATAYAMKAAKEAKLETSWTRPDEEYEAALAAFVAGVCGDAEIADAIAAFVDRIDGAAVVTGLARTLLKLTAPGVPDLYQGTELVVRSLVDPDNRRPVDFELRARLLGELDGMSPEAVLARAGEGLGKLLVIRRALALRKERPAAFGPDAGYRPLAARGAKAAHAVGYFRGGDVAVVVPRFAVGLAGDWGDTTIELPPGTWRNRLTGEETDGGAQELASLLRRFPVGLFEKETEA